MNKIFSGPSGKRFDFRDLFLLIGFLMMRFSHDEVFSKISNFCYEQFFFFDNHNFYALPAHSACIDNLYWDFFT